MQMQNPIEYNLQQSGTHKNDQSYRENQMLYKENIQQIERNYK